MPLHAVAGPQCGRALPLGPLIVAAMTLTSVACARDDQRRSNASQREARIIATDEGFAAPDSVPSGMVHVVFENRGSAIHEVMFIKLPPGMNAEAYLQQVRGGTSFPQGAMDYSGPGLTSPGGSVEQWLQLDPGQYLLACWFRGHLKDTPPTILTVSASDASHLTPPTESVVLRLKDFRFELEGELAGGARVVRVETVGPSLHEVDIFRLHDGKTLADLQTWQAGGKAGPAPADAIGGVLDSHVMPANVWLRTNFRPGRYVLWCSMELLSDSPGLANKATHADAGMFLEFAITS
ncbi:MAG: hypothetical protein ACREOG_03335 [Gemmatimonadaceae bacterium]